MGLKIAVVITTINTGEILEDYCLQLSREDFGSSCVFYVIPDRKSPDELYRRCHELCRKGYIIQCPALLEQEEFLTRVGYSPKLVPYNSDNRRNVGFLMALAGGCDVLISLDDDNYCIVAASVFSEYAIVNNDLMQGEFVKSEAGWFNICDKLKFDEYKNVYPRGFPYAMRHRDLGIKKYISQGVVRLNAGLWLDCPDVDALTWMVAPSRSLHWDEKSDILDLGTWTPVNTQNTSLHRSLLPAYYFPRMDYKFDQGYIDRYGDIFSGYFIQACMSHLKHHVRIGAPVANHRRNAHNYLKDVVRELPCILMLEDILPWLQSLKLSGSDYVESYRSLADNLDDQVEMFTGEIWTSTAIAYFHAMSFCMRKWALVCKMIGV